MTKEELRKELSERRNALPQQGKERLDDFIRKQILSSKEFRRAKTVLLYAPVRGEIDLMPLVDEAWKRRKKVAFPVSNPGKGSMRFYFLEPGMELSPGAYSIPEPPMEAELCTPDSHTLCLVPALAFDQRGGRIGYGGGFYDRFLVDFPGEVMGVIYQKMILPSLPTEPNDVPVSTVVSERGIRRLSHSGELVLQESPIPSQKRIAEDGEDTAIRPLHFPPLLVLLSFGLLLLSRLIEDGLTNRGGVYLSVILLQILIFLIPAALYIRLQKESFAERIRIHLVHPKTFWFCACVFVVMITGSLLFGVISGGIANLNQSFTLYNTFVAHAGRSAWETLYVVLAYAVLPAFCEELMFRSVICAEYERVGAGLAVLTSALFFAMMHFSLALFPNYLLLGILLAGSMYVTRSVLSSMILHLLYNLFCLFGQPFLSKFYMETGSTQIFLYCLVLLFLLFSAFAAGEAKQLYRSYAKKHLSSSYTKLFSWKEFPTRLKVFFTPAFFGCIAIWLIFTLI